MFLVRLAVSEDIEQILAMDSFAKAECRRCLLESAVHAGECLVAERNGVQLGYGTMIMDFSTVASYPSFMSTQPTAGAATGLPSSTNWRASARLTVDGDSMLWSCQIN